MSTRRKRLPIALGAYAVIGLAATFTLDGHLRWIVLLLLAALVVKTWIALRREAIEAAERESRPPRM